ncbi:hypothetical protein ODJ79_22170 [Actinoplanes sp. KI2]|uniref:hypothetical protein n=1 Tax=Actinoplanes sp. KI2 TaxID=2983315 RepID=UPI0021D61338|nr:hypothetical protein [Actinoplanes sp. KI2]MCU7726446.1 hypothetical protein [Actinoplanes sp. KI2]
MNLQDSPDDYAALDARLLAADAGALFTLDRILDIDAALATIKITTAREYEDPPTRDGPAASRPIPCGRWEIDR